jgi:micrococcal nuclease
VIKASYIYKATVISVIDGDSVHLDVDVGFHCHFFEKFRLAHIDTPEKKDKEGWLKATTRLKDLLPVGSVCTINSYGQDKYGRWLVVIYAQGDVSLNQVLLDEGLAVPYERK